VESADGRIPRRARRRPLARHAGRGGDAGTQVVATYMALTLLWFMAVVILVEVGENDRMRGEVDAVALVLGVAGVGAVARRLVVTIRPGMTNAPRGPVDIAARFPKKDAGCRIQALVRLSGAAALLRKETTMPPSKEMIGRVLSTGSATVSAEHVAGFAAALGDTNPEYGTLAPPTYPIAFMTRRCPAAWRRSSSSA